MSKLDNRTTANSSLQSGLSSSSKTVFYSVVIFIGVASWVVNALVLAVLLRRQLRHEYSKSRGHLIFITAVEIAFTIVFIITQAFLLLELFEMWLVVPPIIVFCFFWAFNAARNWAIAVVTTARAEAIGWPLRSRSRRLFTTTRIMIATLCVSLIIFIWGMSFGLRVSPSSMNLRISYDSFIFEMVMLFILIRCFPILAVVIGTVIIVTKLRRSKHYPSQSAQDLNEQKLTRTVIFLAVSFTVFEGTSILFYLCNITLIHDSSLMSNVVDFMDGCFAILNSFSNIFAFVFSNKNFQNEAKEIFKIKRSESSAA